MGCLLCSVSGREQVWLHSLSPLCTAQQRNRQVRPFMPVSIPANRSIPASKSVPWVVQWFPCLRIRAEMDEGGGPLIGAHSYCSQVIPLFALHASTMYHIHVGGLKRAQHKFDEVMCLEEWEPWIGQEMGYCVSKTMNSLDCKYSWTRHRLKCLYLFYARQTAWPLFLEHFVA